LNLDFTTIAEAFNPSLPDGNEKKSLADLSTPKKENSQLPSGKLVWLYIRYELLGQILQLPELQKCPYTFQL
jgi:hypothetical protein